jgi:hypothetical protein
MSAHWDKGVGKSIDRRATDITAIYFLCMQILTLPGAGGSNETGKSLLNQSVLPRMVLNKAQ